MAASTTDQGDPGAPPPSTTQRIYTTLESFVHTALIYASPLIPPQSQETLKQTYKTRPYLSTFITIQLLLLLLPLTILASLLFTLSFVLLIVGLLTFIFWAGILFLSAIPILLFTFVVGCLVWGWAAAAYSAFVFAGMGRDMVLGGEGGEGQQEWRKGLREVLREKVGEVKQEVEAEMAAAYGAAGVYNSEKVVKKEEPEVTSLPAFEVGKEGPGKVPGVEDHVPGKKEAGFETEDELFEPEEPMTIVPEEPMMLANGGDDVMRSISRSLN